MGLDFPPLLGERKHYSGSHGDTCSMRLGLLTGVNLEIERSGDRPYGGCYEICIVYIAIREEGRGSWRMQRCSLPRIRGFIGTYRTTYIADNVARMQSAGLHPEKIRKHCQGV